MLGCRRCLPIAIGEYAGSIPAIPWLASGEPTPSSSSRQEVSCRSMANALSPTMTVRDFENGYWYLDHLKNFAERIGIPAAKKLRKDELEKAILAFLCTGTPALPTKRSLR